MNHLDMGNAEAAADRYKPIAADSEAKDSVIAGITV